MFADFLCDHDRTVLSARTPECDRQIAFALMDIVREQVHEQIGNARNEFPGLRERANVLGEARIASRQWPKLGHEMWIGQEAYVKNQVGVLGNSLTKSEAHAGHQNAFLRGLFLKTLGDVGAKLVNVDL